MTPMLHVVEIAGIKTTSCIEDELITYSLGSCLGVVIYDPAEGIGGMLHCMLPLSRMNEAKARENPAMFADSGVVMLLRALYGLGASRFRMRVKVAGGGTMMDAARHFNIGERNYEALRRVLSKNGLAIAAEEIGGAVPRTLHHSMRTGRTQIRSCGDSRDL